MNIFALILIPSLPLATNTPRDSSSVCSSSSSSLRTTTLEDATNELFASDKSARNASPLRPEPTNEFRNEQDIIKSCRLIREALVIVIARPITSVQCRPFSSVCASRIALEFPRTIPLCVLSQISFGRLFVKLFGTTLKRSRG